MYKGDIMATLISVLTNQFFLIFLAIALGLLLGKVKIGNFSLGVSGGIFSGIVLGYIAQAWAKGVQEGELGYASAASVLKTGVVSNLFFTFFLMLFLVSIGMKVGGSIGAIFKKYGAKFVVIGVMIPVISMAVALIAYHLVFKNNPAVGEFETIGMFAGAMTSTPAYGTALDAAGNVVSGDALEAASSAISLGYTVAFPIGVLVIVVMISALPKLFGINVADEKAAYEKELQESAANEKKLKDGPLDFMVLGLVAAVGILIGNIKIPLGSFGEFSLGAAGGILVSALIFSYIGKIGPINFRMDQKALGILYQTGLTFFMAVVGLRYGYDVINSLMGSGLQLAITAVFVEGIAVLIAFVVGHKVFKINWIILSGAIAGGCTSAPGLGAAISATGSEEPTAGYGAAQPFAILANVLLATLFFNIV